MSQVNRFMNPGCIIQPHVVNIHSGEHYQSSIMFLCCKGSVGGLNPHFAGFTPPVGDGGYTYSLLSSVPTNQMVNQIDHIILCRELAQQ